MLVWINGAFGSGKTQTAFELQRRTGCHVADPELIGYAMRKMLPRSAWGDFQDLPQWRSAVTATLITAARSQRGPVVVPMTLVNPDYFSEIMDGLAAAVPVRHFALIASPETIRQRLQTRIEFRRGRIAGRGDTWAMNQIDRCVSALSTPRFAEHVPADTQSVDEVTEDIATRLGLTLRTPRLGRVRYQARRAAVGIRHIRF